MQALIGKVSIATVSVALLSAMPAVATPIVFSGSGSSYVIGKAVNTEDEDWDF